MQDDGILPDDGAVADAVAQQRPVTDPVPDGRGAAGRSAAGGERIGLEEQRETLDLDPAQDRLSHD